MTTAAVVLAAGGGTRFVGATHKLLAPLADGRPLVVHAVDASAAAGLGEVLVVAGAVDLSDALAAALDPEASVVGPAPTRVTLVHNPRWAEGMATSLQAGLAAATAAGHDAVVVGLGDQPGVLPAAWRLVADATATPIAVATYDGRRGNPVRLAAELWPLLPVTGDEGARSLLRNRSELVTEVPCPGSSADVDTVEDLHRWSS